jgi:N-acylneuraminate cytidylyltransferase
MEIIAFIFARGGSKGLPGKNIKELNGKPLIGWSIEQAKQVKSINRIIVSTDCNKIANVAKKYGAEVPFIRPKELAQDNSPEWMAWRHALCYLNDREGHMPDIMLSLPTTAPLRRIIDIENCIKLYRKGNTDVVITITKAHRSPYFNMVKEVKNGYVDLVNKPNKKIYRRQDSPDVFDMTTVAYVMNPKFVMHNESIFDGRVKAITVPIETSIDIDNSYDFKIAKFFINNSGA